jgi:hypothetical protein
MDLWFGGTVVLVWGHALANLENNIPVLVNLNSVNMII